MSSSLAINEEAAVRQYPRHDVDWIARIELGESGIVTGRIKDHSDGGLCFEPECGFAYGDYIDGENAINMFNRDDVVLAVYIDDGAKAWDKKCAVRWSGRSDHHECLAIGLEFIN